MVEHAAISLPVEIEKGVIGEVHYRGFIRFSTVGNHQFVIVGKPIFHHDGELTGETLFTIGSDIIEVGLLAIYHAPIPYTRMEAAGTAMQCIRSVVGLDAERFAIDGETSVRDAVCKSSGCYAMINLVRREVPLYAIKSEHHIGGIPAFVGHDKPDNPGSIVGKGHGH